MTIVPNSKLLLQLVVVVVVSVELACANAIAEQNSGNSNILQRGSTAILLRLFNNPIRLYRPAVTLSYRMSSVDVRNNSKTLDNVRVSTLVTDRSEFQHQTESGLAYNPQDYVTFYSNVTDPAQTSFALELVDLGKTISLASGFIAPFQLDETSGYRNISLIDRELNVVGIAIISYLVVRPITSFNPMWSSYSDVDDVHYMGHRGTGIGRRNDLPGRYLENTIAAFNFVASKGAPMVELDVQLSKEKIPIVFHDFDIKTYLFNRYHHSRNISANITLKDFNYNQLQELSTSDVPKHIWLDPQSNQPFETLANVLQQVNPLCGINVEIKYPQLDTNLTYESEPGVELNEYTDRILQVLYQHAENRKIVITSFHADLCTMVQLKQNRFRVGFLTSGNSSLWDPDEMMYYDPRTQSVENAVAFVQSFQMKGLSLEVQDVTHNPAHVDYVRSRHLDLYLWGSKLDNYEQLQLLRKQGVNALIFDRFDRVMANHPIPTD